MNELDKWSEVSVEASWIREFLSSQSSKAMLCKVFPDNEPHQYLPLAEAEITELIYDYFQIDSQKLEQERRELLDTISRKCN